MKIALLHYSAPPVVGGVESVINHHARLMDEARHKIWIVAGRGEQMDERLGFIRIPLVDSRHPVVLSIKEQLDKGIVPAEFNKHVDRLTNELRDVLNNMDCVIAHNVCSLNKNLILTAALKKISEESSVPRFVLWHHDLAWTTPRYRDELHEGYPWDLLSKPWNGVEQVTISEFRRQELAGLMSLPEEKISVIPNGVDIQQFLKLEQKTAEFIDQFDLLIAYPILLLPVRITPRKNIEFALQVMREIFKTEPSAKLIITGPIGPHNPANIEYFERLKSMRNSLALEGIVHFLAEYTDEFLPDEVISDFYRLVDALFLPSREEGFGIPILEAGLTGIPVFCADIPPLRDLGGSSVSYFSLDEQPAAIASMIMNELSTSDLFKLRKKIRSQFAWRQVYQQQIQPLLERVYKK